MLKERKGLEWRVKTRGKGHGMRIREASRQPAYRESGEHRLSQGVAGLGPLLLSLSRGSPGSMQRQPARPDCRDKGDSVTATPAIQQHSLHP